MERDRRGRATRRIHVAVPLFLVVVYAGFAVLALVRGKWVVAVVLASFLPVVIVMLRQRLRDGEPVPFTATLVRLLQRR